MTEQLLNFLLKNQNADGGWGYFPGKGSALEPTAYAVMSLRQAPSLDNVVFKARDFIKTRQMTQGGWPVSTSDTDPATWVSALVGLAVLATEGFNSSCQSAARFVLSSFGKIRPNGMTRISEWLGYRTVANINTDLGGWGWNPGTAIWVEPTCYCLIFLKKLRGKIEKERFDAIIAEGESMLYDRMCRAGGWNYGNAQVLGEELRPYPLTTALALIALQNHATRFENRKSLTYLSQAMASEKSADGLSYASLCFDIYSQEGHNLLKQLADRYQEMQFFRNVKTTSLALLALQAKEGRNIYKQEIEPRP